MYFRTDVAEIQVEVQSGPVAVIARRGSGSAPVIHLLQTDAHSLIFKLLAQKALRNVRGHTAVGREHQQLQ